MATMISSIRLWGAHNLSDWAGPYCPTDYDRLIRCIESLPALQALEDGREITSGLYSTSRGILVAKEPNARQRREPGPQTGWMSIKRNNERHMQVVMVLVDAGGFLKRIEKIARQVLSFYNGLVGGRIEEEPQLSGLERSLMAQLPKKVFPALNFSPRLRWYLRRLGVEFEQIFTGAQQPSSKRADLARRALEISWSTAGEGSGTAASVRTNAANQQQIAQGQSRQLAVAPPKMPSLNKSSFGTYKTFFGIGRFQPKRTWIGHFEAALDWEAVCRVQDLCTRAAILLQERKRLGTVIPLEALRAALQGDQIPENARHTLMRWIELIQTHRKSQKSFKELLNVLISVVGMEGPKWRSRALLAEVLSNESIPLQVSFSNQMMIRQGSREIPLIRHQQASEWTAFKQRDTAEGPVQELFVFPRCNEIERCRWVVRQIGRQVDYPRPSRWEPIAEGGWKVSSHLTCMNDFREAIQAPRTLDHMMANEAWIAQVDLWRNGRALPPRFRAEEIFCEQQGSRSQIVWLTPTGPVSYTGKKWERLLQDIQNWMGEEAYLSMVARLGWGRQRETELLVHIAGISLSNPGRRETIMQETRDSSPAEWWSWVNDSLSKIKSVMEEERAAAFVKIRDHYLGADNSGRRGEINDRIGAAAIEQIRHYGPCIAFLSKAFKRVPYLVAQAMQLCLRNPLEAVRPALAIAVQGLDPESVQYLRLIDQCGVASDSDRRILKQLFRILYCATSEQRRVLGPCLAENVQELAITPERFNALLGREQGIVGKKLIELIQRQLTLLTRSAMTQPNEAAVAARAWEAPV